MNFAVNGYEKPKREIEKARDHRSNDNTKQHLRRVQSSISS